MKKKKQKGKNYTIVLVVVSIIILTAMFILIVHNKQSEPANLINQQTTSQSVTTPIQNVNDLNKVSRELDTTDIDNMDQDLNQLDSDLASF